MTFCSAPPPIREDRLASQKGGFVRNGFTVAQGFRDRSIDESIWLVSFPPYDLGYFDLEQRTLQPLDNPFGPKPVTDALGYHLNALTNTRYSAFLA